MEYIEYLKKLPPIQMYKTNEEYRECIRKTFRFDRNEKFVYKGVSYDFEELDSETKDELLFDSSSTGEALDAIFNLTHNEPFFQMLYLKAAGLMFSDSPKIGQCVVCSFSTFQWYYTCIWYYLHDELSLMVECPEYTKLKEHFEV